MPSAYKEIQNDNLLIAIRIQIMKAFVLIALLALDTAAWSEDGILFSDIDTTSRVIMAVIATPGGIKDPNSLMLDNWYARRFGEKFLAQCRDSDLKYAEGYKANYGEATGKYQLLASKRIDTLLTIIYLKDYSIKGLPIKFVYIKKGNSYFITSIQYGLELLSDIDKDPTPAFGKMPPEVNDAPDKLPQAQEGLKYKDLDSSSRTIVEDFSSPNGIVLAAGIIENNWYNPNERATIISRINEQMRLQQSEFTDTYGEPTKDVRLCLSTRLGPYLTILYFKDCSLAPCPVRIIYLKKGDLYYVARLSRGKDAFTDVFKYAPETLGKIAPEVEPH